VLCEEGDTGLANLFKASFTAAKNRGLKVLVTISHSAPYGVGDAAVLMQSFFPNTNIDYMSPQLYTSGNEAQNDYSISQGVQWEQYKNCRAAIIPSIVSANMHSSAVSYFKNKGVNITGYIQWKQG